jgi:hypothetical protein
MVAQFFLCVYSTRSVDSKELHPKQNLWLSKAGKYLCVANNLGKVFRATFIELVCQASYYLPANTLGEWNVYMSVRVMVH